MVRTLVVAVFVAIFAATTIAEAQQAPRPPQRPPWKDVCCGGPCCAKPRLPGR